MKISLYKYYIIMYYNLIKNKLLRKKDNDDYPDFIY